MSVRVEHRQNTTKDTTRNFSPAIWSDCPWDDIVDPKGAAPGAWFFDDFVSMPLVPTETTQVAYDKYKVFAGANGSTLLTPTSSVNSVDLGGGILGLVVAANNDAATIAQSYPAFKISGSTATSGKLWFEARLAIKSLLTLREGFFLGLAETNLQTLSATVPFNADAAVPDNSGAMIGFNKWEIVSTTAAATTSLPGGVNTSYNDRAITFTQVQADATIISAAFAFVKLGFVYNPADPVNTVKFFADNIQLTSVIAASTITATTNLKANSLGLMLATIAASSVSTDAVYLDWWRIAQLSP